MRYTVTTFKVRLEVCDVGDSTAASGDVVRVARPIFAELDADKEHFVLLALNNKNRINGYKLISTGTLTASLIRPGDVYRAALHLAAAAVVFVHNHPSCDPAASQEDVEITRRLKEFGEMLVRYSITLFWERMLPQLFGQGDFVKDYINIGPVPCEEYWRQYEHSRCAKMPA